MRFQDLYKLVSERRRKTIAVAAADNADLLAALFEAKRKRIAEAILIGDREKIRLAAHKAAVPVGEFAVRHIEEPSYIAPESVKLVRQGEADLLMKGNVTTSELMRAVLEKETGLRTGKVLSHIAVTEMSSYHKLMFFTDGGINIDQDTRIKTDIVANAVNVCHRLGLKKPAVALLTLVESVNPKLPETETAQQLVHLWEKGEFPDCILEGPIALDVALSGKAAEKKGISSNIAGETDVFVGANITATNHIVKALVTLGNARVGGIIVGAKAPVVLLSRSDSSQTKLDSLIAALALGDS